MTRLKIYQIHLKILTPMDWKKTCGQLPNRMWSSPRIKVLLLNYPKLFQIQGQESAKISGMWDFFEDMFFTFYDITTLNSTYQAKLKAPGWGWGVFGRLFGGLEGEDLSCDDCHNVFALVVTYLFTICLHSIPAYLFSSLASWDAWDACIPLSFFFGSKTKNSQEKCENFKPAVFFPSNPRPVAVGGVGGKFSANGCPAIRGAKCRTGREEPQWMTMNKQPPWSLRCLKGPWKMDGLENDMFFPLRAYAYLDGR